MIHYVQLLEQKIAGAFHVELGTLYFYTETVGDPYAERKPYVGVATVIWESPHRIWLRALRADMDRAMQRELLEWLIHNRIKCVKAEREPGRSLPFARRNGDHFEIDVAELIERFKVAEMPKPHRRADDPP